MSRRRRHPTERRSGHAHLATALQTDRERELLNKWFPRPPKSHRWRGQPMRAGDVAAALGKGMAATAIGTAAMTLMSTTETKQCGREPRSTPAEAAAKCWA